MDGIQKQPNRELNRAIAALEAMASLWQKRIDGDWEPPSESSFPWAMVRRSLEALLSGLANSGDWCRRAVGSESFPTKTVTPKRIAHILAGNTPLLAWSGFAATLLAGHRSIVKMSRSETVWCRLFVESLTEVDAELAGTFELNLWAGDDTRTADLMKSADAVIAYGSDTTLTALHQLVSSHTPFFGYGHALSIGLVLPDADLKGTALGFAIDTLMYNQLGCLSPQAIYVVGDLDRSRAFAELLPSAMDTASRILEVLPVSDAAIARRIRTARDLALFAGTEVIGDTELRWTVLTHNRESDLPVAVGYSVLPVIPLRNLATLSDRLARVAGKVSSIGIAGTEVSEDWLESLRLLGVSRICRAGEMQTPPLDWQNGNRDILEELCRL